MTDKERIEEMAREIEFAKKGLWNAVNLKDDSYDWHSRGIAQHLLGMGYRKIPEGSVVLSKEEYEELEELRLNHAKDLINANKLYEERIADLKIEFDNHIKNLEEKIDRRDRDLNSQANRLIDLKEKLAQARKETAREILEAIKLKAWGNNADVNGKIWSYSISIYALAEIAKQFCDEIKE